MSGRTMITGMIAAVGFVLSAPAVLANRPIGTTITGTVTAVSGTEWLTVDGRMYRVKAGSAAAAALPQVRPGEVVDVTLDGAPTTSASEVIAVSPHSGG